MKKVKKTIIELINEKKDIEDLKDVCTWLRLPNDKPNQFEKDMLKCNTDLTRNEKQIKLLLKEIEN